VHLTAGAGERDVEAVLATGLADRTEVAPHGAVARGAGERGGEDDDVALVALHVLDVLDDEGIVAGSRRRMPEGVEEFGELRVGLFGFE
jgi:hypothetical protein